MNAETKPAEMSLATAFQIVLGLAKDSAFTKTQVGASPELNAVMQREQEALAMIEGFAEGYCTGQHDGLPNEVIVETMAPEEPQPTITTEE